MSTYTTMSWRLETETFVDELDEQQTLHFVMDGPLPVCLQAGDDEGLAKARLIAAAPELLKALQDIIVYTECAPAGGDAAMLYELYHSAKAAIHKATGDSL